MDSTVIELLAILVLVLANGFFAASEFALIASRKSRLKNMARKGDARAKAAMSLLIKPDRFLATIQVGIAFIATLVGVFGGATLVDNLASTLRTIPFSTISSAAHPIAIGIVVVCITVLSVVLGELIPKYIALSNPEKIALAVIRPISLFSRLAFFFVGMLTFLSRLILRLFGLSRIPERSYITDEEINILVSEGTEKGVFDETEKKLIKSVFDFTDISVRQSMTPRVDIVGIQIDLPQEQVLEVMTMHGFSRYPVYSDSLDKIEGVVYTKDLISLVTHGEVIILRDIIRKPLFVPDSMPLTRLLQRFQRKKKHIAIVLDEFGGTAGLITLEDILEEIVGDIKDEHDTEQPEFVAHSSQIAFAAATLRPHELNEEFGVGVPEDVADTLGGLIVEILGRVPDPSEIVTIRKARFKILEMEGNRIVRLRVEKV